MEKIFMAKYLLLLLLVYSPVTLFAMEQPTQLKFADSLAAENDHYRAITEYKRFIFLEPNSPFVPQARLSIANSLIGGNRWDQADASLEDLIRRHPESPEAIKGRLLYAETAYERGNFGLARDRYRALAKLQTDVETLNYTNFRIGWTFLEQDSPSKAKDHFSLMPEQQKDLLLRDLNAYQELPQKSPFLAGALSAVLPGSGQLYTGRLRQAALSFLLNGAFILGAIEAFHNENYAVGSIFLFFEIGWYGGNIYNAVNNAHKFNVRAKHDFKQQMRSRLNLHLGMLEQTPLVVMNYRF
jgi:tetratricopeptide (TPR) repeat protein